MEGRKRGKEKGGKEGGGQTDKGKTKRKKETKFYVRQSEKEFLKL